MTISRVTGTSRIDGKSFIKSKKNTVFSGAAGKGALCLWQASDHHAENPQSWGVYLCEVGHRKEILYARKPTG